MWSLKKAWGEDICYCHVPHTSLIITIDSNIVLIASIPYSQFPCIFATVRECFTSQIKFGHVSKIVMNKISPVEFNFILYNPDIMLV